MQINNLHQLVDEPTHFMLIFFLLKLERKLQYSQQYFESCTCYYMMHSFSIWHFEWSLRLYHYALWRNITCYSVHPSLIVISCPTYACLKIWYHLKIQKTLQNNDVQLKINYNICNIRSQYEVLKMKNNEIYLTNM